MEFKDQKFKEFMDLRSALPQMILNHEVTPEFEKQLHTMTDTEIQNLLGDVRTSAEHLTKQRDIAEYNGDKKTANNKQEELMFCFRIIDSVGKEIDKRNIKK